MSTLNITHGDSAANIMQRAGIEGDILCWRDVLHEGPVPMLSSLEALSTIRAGFITQAGWGPATGVHRDFALQFVATLS